MYHKPVLYDEVIDNLVKDEYNIYLDCTLGGAGHSLGILKNSNKNAILIGIDQDINAINHSKEYLKDYSNRVKIFKNNFENLKLVTYMAGFNEVNCILMDIGVSSKQLDDPSRGFSYKYEAKLDMRMDESNELTAYKVINEYSEKELADIIYRYGEEPKARRIAQYIIKYREKEKIETTTQLADIIINAVGKSMKKHPAKRTFQALRIYVNNELKVLEKAIDEGINILSDGGRIGIITFHSLEDRIVKDAFRRYENPCECPAELPVCVCNKKSAGRVYNKKVIIAKKEELENNNRSHSAKLRIFERKK